MTSLSQSTVRPFALGMALTALSACLASVPVSQGTIPPFEQAPKGDPSFFVTSRGIDGGNLGGLAGADAHCSQLAAEAGLPNRNWRAYLSTQATPTSRAVNARGRIGQGPWFNVERIRISRDLAHLHGDTAALARAGQADRGRHRGRVIPETASGFAFLKGPHHRLTAFHLHRDHLRSA